MWLLHVVIVQGGGSWQTALALASVALLAGGCFAWLAGEHRDQDALLTDLALAAAGGAAANAAAAPLGTDILALIFDVRVLITAAGGVLALCLAHDLARFVAARGDRLAAHLPIGDHGGFVFLLLWLSGWPSEPGLIEATYANGLQVKLLAESLHYQVRAGPFRASRTIPLINGVHSEARNDTLVLSGALTSSRTDGASGVIRLENVRPLGYAATMSDRIAARPLPPITGNEDGAAGG